MSEIQTCLKSELLWVQIWDNVWNQNCLETEQSKSVWNPYWFEFQTLTVRLKIDHFQQLFYMGVTWLVTAKKFAYTEERLKLDAQNLENA